MDSRSGIAENRRLVDGITRGWRSAKRSMVWKREMYLVLHVFVVMHQNCWHQSWAASLLTRSIVGQAQLHCRGDYMPRCAASPWTLNVSTLRYHESQAPSTCDQQFRMFSKLTASDHWRSHTKPNDQCKHELRTKKWTRSLLTLSRTIMTCCMPVVWLMSWSLTAALQFFQMIASTPEFRDSVSAWSAIAKTRL